MSNKKIIKEFGLIWGGRKWDPFYYDRVEIMVGEMSKRMGGEGVTCKTTYHLKDLTEKIISLDTGPLYIDRFYNIKGSIDFWKFDESNAPEDISDFINAIEGRKHSIFIFCDSIIDLAKAISELEFNKRIYHNLTHEEVMEVLNSSTFDPSIINLKKYIYTEEEEEVTFFLCRIKRLIKTAKHNNFIKMINKCSMCGEIFLKKVFYEYEPEVENDFMEHNFIIKPDKNGTNVFGVCNSCLNVCDCCHHPF